MRGKTCCFIGHKKLSNNNIEKIIMRLNDEIEALIHQGVTDFISCGALGFDQIAASIIVAKKETGKQIRLIFALSSKEQDGAWSEKQRQLYHNLLSNADDIAYIPKIHNSKHSMEYMINHAQYCICALSQEKKQTRKMMQYARNKGTIVVNLLR